MVSLRSKIAQKVLNLFFLNKKEKFYVNELAEKIKEDPSNVHKKLIELEKEEILLSEFQGRERYFFLNEKYPFLKEYQNIILKGIGFERILKDELKKVKGVKLVYIFGSYVENKLSAESDIDILVIGSHSGLELQKKLLEIQQLTNRELNSIELTEKEFKQKKKEKNQLLEDIFSKKHLQIL